MDVENGVGELVYELHGGLQDDIHINRNETLEPTETILLLEPKV